MTLLVFRITHHFLFIYSRIIIFIEPIMPSFYVTPSIFDTRRLGRRYALRRLLTYYYCYYYIDTQHTCVVYASEHVSSSDQIISFHRSEKN